MWRVDVVVSAVPEEAKNTPPAPDAYLYDLALQAHLEAAAWLAMARELTGGRSWGDMRHRVDLLVAQRRSDLATAVYRTPR